MKKSKIIVPALALIAFSTAASITGTVAWFTASRTATFNAGTYTVASTAKGLSYSVDSGVGTTHSSHTSVSLTSGYSLTDGSFDHVNEKIFAPAADGKSLADASGIDLSGVSESDLLRANKDSVKYLTAATFSLTVTMEFGETGKSQALFLDYAHTSFLVNSAAPAKTGKAFRMALVAVSADASTKVLALGDSEANAKYISASHVQSASEGNGAAGSFKAGGDAYASGLIANNTTPTALPDDGVSSSNAESHKCYLGTFAFDSNEEVDLEFTVVVWFEGTHTEIKNDNVTSGYESVAVQIGLEAKELAA